MFSGEMGASEYYRRSGNLAQLSKASGQAAAEAPPASGKQRRGTPMVDTYVPPARRVASNPPAPLNEEDEQLDELPALPVRRASYGSPGVAGPSGLQRPASRGSSSDHGSGLSRQSSMSLMDLAMEDETPQRQAQVVQRVVRALEDDQDWLALAVYLSVVGQQMTKQVGDVNLGLVRRRLVSRVQEALSFGSETASSQDLARSVSSPEPPGISRPTARQIGPSRRARRVLHSYFGCFGAVR